MGTHVQRRDNSRRRLALGGALLVLLVALLAGCEGYSGWSRVEIGMFERTGINRSEARFRTFTGTKRWREGLEEGQTLVLEYELALNKGKLTLRVLDPDGIIVWEQLFADGAEADEQIEVDAEYEGTYTIVAAGDNAGGEYELSWDVEE
jgi:hypothetical protein